MSSSKLTSVPALTGIAEKLQEAVRKGVLILQESFRKLNLKEQQLRYVRFLSIAVTISVHLEALFPNLTFPNIISQTSSERSPDSHAFKVIPMKSSDSVTTHSPVSYPLSCSGFYSGIYKLNQLLAETLKALSTV